MRSLPPLLLLGVVALAVGLFFARPSFSRAPAPPPLYPDTPTFLAPPAAAKSDLLYLDFIRKDNAVTNRLETGVFIHFEAISPLARSFKNLKFIQICRGDGGPWRIDENANGKRVALPRVTNPGPYPYFPRQFLSPGGIYLYDRPGHGSDHAPVVIWAWRDAFPFFTRTVAYQRQSRTFQQDFESVVVGVANGKYTFLGGVKWGHRFRDGLRVSDYFGPVAPPPGQISGHTEFIAPAPPSPEFLVTLKAQGPSILPE